jgi:SpoVK/Ycf46/Vps4 family AAA+-type ATPase
MTAAALAGELKLPLFTVLYDGLIGKLMGETAARRRLVFDAIAVQRGVYFFDEFDAIGSQRSAPNDVGEIRRVLNSFLQFLENDDGPSLIVAATNHPELLDKAVFRRFDDVIAYGLPDLEIARGILESHLTGFEPKDLDWRRRCTPSPHAKASRQRLFLYRGLVGSNSIVVTITSTHYRWWLSRDSRLHEQP